MVARAVHRAFAGMNGHRLALVSMLAFVAVSGCGAGPVQFARREPLWEDPDRQPFAGPPDDRYVADLWDAADSLTLRPAVRALALETSGESSNATALDEVADSSWFENRIGRQEQSPARVARGACREGDPGPTPPWQIISGKVDGATRGFAFEDAHGRRYLFKADRPEQPEQTTAADAIAAALYHAAGYHVPCNRVVLFEREWVELEPGAMLDPTSGPERPMTDADVDQVFAVVRETDDGRLRGVASELFEGEPLGPWGYRDRWEPDLNDVVPHEDRRELRGMRMLNAWVDHWDARQLNTLSTWAQDDEARNAGHVEHHLVDFGETLGAIEYPHRAAIRFGRSQFLDFEHVVADFFTFGLVARPWDTVARGPTWPLLGYYAAEGFDPEAWRPNYWNGAFERMTEHDAAWMARIIARFRESHLREVARLGRFSDPAVEERLVEVLLARRQAILERYLTRLSPLAWPVLEGERLCLEDLGISSGLRSAASREHTAELVRGPGARR
ncbi:MAG: hypothetical protein M3Y87_20065, partial [Myxococcota bacterium]|nr:hypothetical protein [Myxococcota bacterium]